MNPKKRPTCQQILRELQRIKKLKQNNKQIIKTKLNFHKDIPPTPKVIEKNFMTERVERKSLIPYQNNNNQILIRNTPSISEYNGSRPNSGVQRAEKKNKYLKNRMPENKGWEYGMNKPQIENRRI